MRVSRKIMTPLAILKAIESLTEAEKETLAILADEKLSKELMERRQEAFIEMIGITLIALMFCLMKITGIRGNPDNQRFKILV